MRGLYAFACFASLIYLTGCGIHPQTEESTKPLSTNPAPAQTPTKLVAIGNSITLHPPDTSLGWNGNWGMAASAQGKDYAHMTAAAMHLPVTPISVTSLETNPKDLNQYLQVIAAAGIDSKTIVVLELGDDSSVSDLTDFASSYGKLISAVSSRMKLVCVSTFWEKPPLDAVIKYECESNGGLYTYIGDIYTDPNNPDRKENAFSNPTVNAHPHDWGMAHIAARIVAEANGSP
jgi:hypothetical protein